MKPRKWLHTQPLFIDSWIRRHNFSSKQRLRERERERMTYSCARISLLVFLSLLYLAEANIRHYKFNVSITDLRVFLENK